MSTDILKPNDIAFIMNISANIGPWGVLFCLIIARVPMGLNNRAFRKGISLFQVAMQRFCAMFGVVFKCGFPLTC